MLQKLLLGLPAFMVGVAAALQGIVNAGLARGLGSSVAAAAVSFWVGALALTGLVVAMGGIGPSLAAARGLAPGWWLAGGLLGAAYVTIITVLVPRIGIGAATAFVIAGQLIAAAVFDHFGLLGIAQQPLTLARTAGIGLLLAGAVLVRFF